MADDTFELLTRMYADFTSQFKELHGSVASLDSRMISVEGRMASMEGKMSSVENKLSTVESRLSSTETKITTIEGDVASLRNEVGRLALKVENDVCRKIDLLFETRSEVNYRLDSIENKIDILTTKVDRHDIEIKVIKAAK